MFLMGFVLRAPAFCQGYRSDSGRLWLGERTVGTEINTMMNISQQCCWDCIRWHTEGHFTAIGTEQKSGDS
jgi:hypothetical protein